MSVKKIVKVAAENPNNLRSPFIDSCNENKVCISWVVYDGTAFMGHYKSINFSSSKLDMESIKKFLELKDAQYISYESEMMTNEKNKLNKKNMEQRAAIYPNIAESINSIINKNVLSLRLVMENKNNNEKLSELIYCIYKQYIYKFDRPGYTDEEMLLQILELEDEERKKFERLKHKYSTSEQVEKEG